MGFANFEMQLKERRGRLDLEFHISKGKEASKQGKAGYYENVEKEKGMEGPEDNRHTDMQMDKWCLY